MLVQRKTRLLLPLVESDQKSEDENLSFFERFKRDSERSKNDGSSARVLCIFLRFLMIFTGLTEPYVFMNYVIPYLFEEYTPMTQYYIKVVMWFFVINMLANWTCLILFDTSFSKTKDNPFLHFDQQSEELPDQFAARIQHAAMHNTEKNGHCVPDTDAEATLSWHYCDTCDMRVPPRAHHCKVCRKCILKRDHHCFLVGTCVGFKNQRYFVMMNFYIAICGLLGGSFTLVYVISNVCPELSYWADMILPVTLVRYLLGYVKGIHCLLITHVYLELIFGALCFFYFNLQLTFVSEGKTPYEVANKIPIRNTNGVNRNWKSVFGDFWGLNILFPMTIVLRQRDDGMTWDELKLDNNSNEVIYKPMVHSL